MERDSAEKNQRWEDKPESFFSRFSQSLNYREAFDLFFQGKKIALDVTTEEKQQVFENSDQAKLAMVEFAETFMEFKYNQIHFPPLAIEAINRYIEAVKKTHIPQLSREERESLDHERSLKHLKLAEILVQSGIAPTTKLGRSLGRLILIGLCLDTYETAKKPDITQIKNKIN